MWHRGVGPESGKNRLSDVNFTTPWDGVAMDGGPVGPRTHRPLVSVSLSTSGG